MTIDLIVVFKKIRIIDTKYIYTLVTRCWLVANKLFDQRSIKLIRNLNQTRSNGRKL